MDPTDHEEGVLPLNWLNTLVISLLTGVLGLLSGGFIMNACVTWYRISGFEGKAGFAVVGVALLGGIAGLVIGVVAARIVASGANPGLLKGLGYGSGSVLGIAVLAAILCRLGADIPPRINGRALELSIEIRCPGRFQNPALLDAATLYAAVYLPERGRQPGGEFLLEQARMENGLWVIPATVPLSTSSAKKFLRVYLSKEDDLMFRLPLQSDPGEEDLDWTEWLEPGWDAGTERPPPEDRFALRYRVVVVEPSPSETEPVEDADNLFIEPGPEAPLEAWLARVNSGGTSEQMGTIMAAISSRPAELAQLIRASDAETRELALAAVPSLAEIAPEVAEAVRTEGLEIADSLRYFNEMDSSDPQFLQFQVELRSRFNYWKRAWWNVFHKMNWDGRPQLQEIHDLAQVRAGDTSMDEIVVNARVILDALNQGEDTNP